ncbi:MAG: exonuclease subunit SbcD, partial [Epsilonproteobacteria bacterium]|nr:exonuclease subunit SbcD [Campylobacterota bacterium]
MKIVHTSDLHIGHLINTIERESEFLELFDWLSQKINKLKPDAFIIAGDIFDQYFPSNSALELYYNFLLSLRDSVEKIIVVGGNHDSFKTLKAPKEILKLLNIVVV